MPQMLMITVKYVLIARSYRNRWNCTVYPYLTLTILTGRANIWRYLAASRVALTTRNWTLYSSGQPSCGIAILPEEVNELSTTLYLYNPSTTPCGEEESIKKRGVSIARSKAGTKAKKEVPTTYYCQIKYNNKHNIW